MSIKTMPDSNPNEPYDPWRNCGCQSKTGPNCNDKLGKLSERIDELTKMIEDHDRRLNVAAKWLGVIDGTIRRMKEVAARYGVNL